MSRLLDIQKLLLEKLHPAFVKGAISICIGAITFLSVYFGTDESKEYIGKFAQWCIVGVFGLAGVVLNQFRDAISAYYTDKNKPPGSGNTEIITRPPQ